MPPAIRGAYTIAKMTKETLLKFLNNNCSDTELNEVIKWIKSEALKEDGKGLAFDDWNKFQKEYQAGDEKFSALFDKIQEKIEAKQLEQDTEKVAPVIKLTRWLTKVAAVLFIPILGLLFYTLSEENLIAMKYGNMAVDSLEVIAPIGSRTVVQLSDGSEVHLNYGSKIKYPQLFSGNTREIRLSGEGFFKIAHNPDKPFVVKTEKLDVKALGTTFNVLAYPGDNVIETTLVEGKVVLDRSAHNTNKTSIGAMKPGQHVKFNAQTGAAVYYEGAIDKYIAWKDGKLKFEDTPLVKVAQKLSLKYNVEIQVSEEVKQYIYTVTFADEPLFQILDLITIATPVRYSTFPRIKLPDGTYSKQKIVITKK